MRIWAAVGVARMRSGSTVGRTATGLIALERSEALFSRRELFGAVAREDLRCGFTEAARGCADLFGRAAVLLGEADRAVCFVRVPASVRRRAFGVADVRAGFVADLDRVRGEEAFFLAAAVFRFDVGLDFGLDFGRTADLRRGFAAAFGIALPVRFFAPADLAARFAELLRATARFLLRAGALGFRDVVVFFPAAFFLAAAPRLFRVSAAGLRAAALVADRVGFRVVLVFFALVLATLCLQLERRPLQPAAAHDGRP